MVDFRMNVDRVADVMLLNALFFTSDDNGDDNAR